MNTSKRDFREVFIITGAPGSGKTTYVKNICRTGDLIVDLDFIGMAISGQKMHSDNKGMLPVLLQVRDSLYDAIEKRVGSWNRAFIVCASPLRSEINELKKRFNAAEIRMTTGRQQCIEQIKNDETRIGQKTQFIAMANQWYDMMEGRF